MDMNTALKRKILPGNRFNKYFKGSKCEVFKLGKGNTDYSLDKMKLWATKYAHHTKALALGEFKGLGLAETVRKVHHFLYWHLQYEIDGKDQKLKSPGCAWATRSEGLDCKSYSIFAGTILQNLGIRYHFRKVRQPGKGSERWTHVYVVVPKDQKSMDVGNGNSYFTLDATVRDNREVVHIEKKDLIMDNVSLQHYGLAGAGTYGMGCSCTASPSPVQRTSARMPILTSRHMDTAFQNFGLSSPSPSEALVFKRAMDNFRVYVDDLVRAGLSPETGKMAIQRLATFIKRGIEPTVLDLFAEPIKNTSGLGFANIVGDINAPLLRSIDQLPTATQARLRSGGPRVTGANISSAASLVSKLIPKKIYERTFGAVFANGFNFKCWGASWNPKKAENELATIIPQLRARAEAVLRTPWSGYERAVNQFMKDFYKVNARHRDWLATTAKDCTKDGLKILIGGLDSTKIIIKNEFIGHAERNGHQLNDTSPVTQFYKDPQGKGHDLTQSVEQFRFVQAKPLPTTGTGNGNRSGRTTDPDLSPTFVDVDGKLKTPRVPLPPGPKKDEAGFGTVATVGIGLLALGALYKNSQTKKAA